MKMESLNGNCRTVLLVCQMSEPRKMFAVIAIAILFLNSEHTQSCCEMRQSFHSFPHLNNNIKLESMVLYFIQKI